MATLREQFIERLIREFFLKKGNGFVLKGGGAIRTLFGEQRLTKDIDLDFINPKRTSDSLHNTVTKAIESAGRGLSVKNLAVASPGKGERSPRWKINFNDPAGRPFHVEVEISRDPARAVPGAVVQKPFAPEAAQGIARFWVDIYDEPALMTTKLAALLGREVPRDVYDLDLLIATSHNPSFEQIQWAIKRAGIQQHDVITRVRDRLDAMNWDRYQSELRDNLPEPVAERIDSTEWQAIKHRVGDYIEHLIQQLPEAPS